MHATRHGVGFGRLIGFLVAVGVAVGLALLTPTRIDAAPLVVNSSSDSAATCGMMGTLCLREAMAMVSAGGTITFDPAVTGTIALTRGALQLSTPATISGPGAATLTVSGNAMTTDAVFSLVTTGDVAISGLTVTGGAGNSGIYSDGTTLTLTGVTVRGNFSYYQGGGIDALGGSLTLTGSTVTSNHANYGGGIFAAHSLTIDSSTIDGNSSGIYGGGVQADGPLIVRNGSVISHNVVSPFLYVGLCGGGIWAGSTTTITGSTVAGNLVQGGGSAALGGGICAESDLTIDSSVIGGPTTADGNILGTAGEGAAIFATGGTLTIRNGTVIRHNQGQTIVDAAGPTTITSSTVSDNTALGQCGCVGFNSGTGIDTKGSTTVTASTIARNSGYGISVQGDLTIDSSMIGGPNGGDGNFGGIRATGPLIVRNGTVIRGNAAGNLGNGTALQGGGIFAGATATITDSTIAGNIADTGAGIYAKTDLTVDHSLIGGLTPADGNKAMASPNTGLNGGGIFTAGGTLTIRNGTVIQGNTAPAGNGSGGGVYASGPLTITDSTVAGNAVYSSGGGIAAMAGLTAVNTTVSGNNAPGLGSGIVVTGDATLTASTITLNTGSPAVVGLDGGARTLKGDIVVGNPGGDGLGGLGFVDGGGNILSGNPLLAPLASYPPGTVLTHALLPGSPALDMLSPCPTDPSTLMPLATDERGVARPQGAKCDSGAFESQGFTLTPNGDQTTAAGQSFANPVAVTVAARDSGVPVDGGSVTFTLIPGSASATFAASGSGCVVSMDRLTAVCPIMGGMARTPTVTAGATATGTLTARASAGTGMPASVTLTVTPGPGTLVRLTATAPVGAGSGNTGTATNVIIAPGTHLTLTTQGTFGNGMSGMVSGLTYLSSDPTKVVVDANGTITGIAPTGSTPVTITVTAPNGVQTTLPVTVATVPTGGLMNPNPQPMTRPSMMPATVMPAPQPINHPVGTGQGSVPPQAAGSATATPNAQPARH